MTTSVVSDAPSRPRRTPLLHTQHDQREPPPARRRPDQPRHRLALGDRCQRKVRPRRRQQHPRSIGRAAPDPQPLADMTPPIDLDDTPAQIARRADQTHPIRQRINNMSSTTLDCRAVQIPKPHGDGVRMLGAPTIADRVAQTVVAMQLEPVVEPRFHPDSYGFRPGRSAHDALAACRQRCWKYDWVIDLDVQKFFDEVPWDLIVKAVQAVTDARWVLLYVKRWLAAPLQHPDGSLEQRSRGTPQGAL